MSMVTNNAAWRVEVEPLSTSNGRYEASLAVTGEQVRESQALRYQVFAEEMGAQLHSDETGIDKDDLDPWCMHLLVRDTETGRLVGSTRLLDGDSARQFGRFYSASEFDLSAIEVLPGRKLEVGRTCVHAEFRTGAVIGALWQGLAELMYREQYQWLFGCASITWEEGGANVHAIMDRFRRNYLSPANQRVTPRLAVPASVDGDNLTALRIPPLLKAYVSLGAKICGEPCWDPDFNVADVFVLLEASKLSKRYVRHFARSE